MTVAFGLLGPVTLHSTVPASPFPPEGLTLLAALLGGSDSGSPSIGC